MKRILAAACALALVCAPLAGCLPPSVHGGPSQAASPAQIAARAMLAAETSFNIAATAELDAKGTGLLSGDKAAKADAVRHQAYAALLGLRAVYAAGQSPDLTSLLLLTNQLLVLAGQAPGSVTVPVLPTL